MQIEAHEYGPVARLVEQGYTMEEAVEKVRQATAPKAPTPKKNKYNAKKTEVDGLVFDSKKEARRYMELRVLEAKGEISELELQPPYPVEINGKHIFTYKADFRYLDEHGRAVIEDVKSSITQKNPTYRLKKKAVEAAYGLVITEV